jgi:hypothetical protein
LFPQEYHLRVSIFVALIAGICDNSKSQSFKRLALTGGPFSYQRLTPRNGAAAAQPQPDAITETPVGTS